MSSKWITALVGAAATVVLALLLTTSRGPRSDGRTAVDAAVASPPTSPSPSVPASTSAPDSAEDERRVKTELELAQMALATGDRDFLGARSLLVSIRLHDRERPELRRALALVEQRYAEILRRGARMPDGGVHEDNEREREREREREH